MIKWAGVVVLLGVSCGLCAQAPAVGGAGGAAAVQTAGRAPALLPGNGLAQHDFVYSGESHDRKIFIVRGGKIVWSYDDPAGRGEISDMVMLSNGNILFAHQFGVTEIAPDKKVVWNYDAAGGTRDPYGRAHRQGSRAVHHERRSRRGAARGEHRRRARSRRSCRWR